MNDSTTEKRPLGTRWCSIGFIVTIVGVVLAGGGILGGQAGLLGTMGSFLGFGLGLLAFVVAAVMLLIGLLLSKGSGGAVPAVRAWGAFVVVILAFAAIGNQRPDYESGPPIHDLTTDVTNPPAFDAIAPLRADAPNPVEYAGPETAAQQQAAFPDLKTLILDKPAGQVFASAEKIARDMNWEIVSADAAKGIIEATDTTRWFRFKDDVVIRIVPTDAGTAVDMRSKSRVGQGDMGTNTHRIRTFLERLKNA